MSEHYTLAELEALEKGFMITSRRPGKATMFRMARTIRKMYEHIKSRPTVADGEGYLERVEVWFAADYELIADFEGEENAD